MYRDDILCLPNSDVCRLVVHLVFCVLCAFTWPDSDHPQEVRHSLATHYKPYDPHGPFPRSLKHIPFVGWVSIFSSVEHSCGLMIVQGMQFFRFLFLARSWSQDRVYLGKHLDKVSKRAQSVGDALSLIIFPEGTLVSKDTRPLSKKFADKSGIVR